MSLKRKKRMVIISTLSVIIVLVFVLFLWNFLDKRSSKIVSTEILELTIDESSSNLENDISNEAILPEDNSMDMHNEDGQNVDIATILTSNRVDEIEGTTYGIDVAKYQGEIDWQKVADSGLDFAMIRIGYRTQKTGIITEDSLAAYNLQQALKAGLKVGVYFFSTAVTLEEAVEEATWVANYIAPYSITYPVAYNCEGFQKEDSRQYLLSTKERSDIAIQFLTSIYESSYTPMFYAAKNELEGDYLWDTSRIEKSFKIWVAQYPDVAYETSSKSDYAGTHVMWQYTNNGVVDGISKSVDINIAYFDYNNVANALSSIAVENAEYNVEALMNFSEVNEEVTAKDKTNLRNRPSQEENSTIVTTLKNGEIAIRTGISASGWSRITFNDTTYYAVSNFLTNDISYKTPSSTIVPTEDTLDGIKTKFTAISDTVSPKMEVNLRSLPSVTNPDSNIIATLKNGEKVSRTGINTELGWSRIDYNGQTLYCVSSYLNIITGE